MTRDLCQSCQCNPPVVRVVWPGRDPFVLCAGCSEKCRQAAIDLGVHATAVSLFAEPGPAAGAGGK